MFSVMQSDPSRYDIVFCPDSLNSTDPAELAEAEARLIGQRFLVKGYLDPMGMSELMESETGMEPAGGRP